MGAVGPDGRIESPYAKLAVAFQEAARTVGVSSDGGDSEVDREVWLQLIDRTVYNATGGNVSVTNQHDLGDGAVAFVLEGVEARYLKGLRWACDAHLPQGHSIIMNDAPLGQHVRISRAPSRQAYYIKVTRRAQANLETWRWARQNAHTWDVRLHILSWIGMAVSAFLYRRHVADYHDPWQTWADAAAGALEEGWDAVQ